MPSCCFCGRLQEATVKNEGLTFYIFPKENPTLAVWMEFAKKCSTEVKSESVVCAAHFTQYCFENVLQSVHLKKLAVPTIMIQNVESTKSIYPELLMPFDQCKQKRDLVNELSENNDMNYIFSQSSTEHYVKITDSVSNMEGVDSIISFDDLDNNISIKDNHLSNFIIKTPQKMKPKMKNQKVNICETASNNSPKKSIGKRKTINSAYQINLKNKRIKYLTQKVQCQRKMISSLQNIITTLKNNTIFHQDNADNDV